MDLKTYETLRIMMTARALLYDPHYERFIEQERLQAQRLSTFIPHRLSEINANAQDLANTLEIEVEFVQTLMEGSFPLSIISLDFWRELAAALQCSVATLHKIRYGITTTL